MENNLYNVVISFGPSAQQWAFLFKSSQGALQVMAAFDAMSGSENPCVLGIADDFGSVCRIRVGDIHGISCEEMSVCADAHIERSINQLKTQVKANNKARNDPLLKFSAVQQPAGPMNGRPF